MLVGLAVLVVIGVIAAVLFWPESKQQDEAKAPAVIVKPTTEPTPVDVNVKITTYTTSNEGFRDKGGFWDTNTYNTSEFGGLKPGAGLVLDLGSAMKIDSVTFNAKSGPLTVELRSADDRPIDQTPVSRSGGKVVGDSTSATGKTTLDGSKGGKHRYWMIWVTNLGPTKKGIISDVSVTAMKS
jgi:hypothetical protein